MAERLTPDRGGAGDLLLAIESATRRASVALLRGPEVVAELAAPSGDPQAERLLPMVDELLEKTGVTLRDVGAFAVSIGPGAFTSLRIGLATVKGLAFGTDVPVAPVSTLHALAEAALGEGRVEAGELCVPLLDARRGAFYAGGYRCEPGGQAGEPPSLGVAIEDAVHSPAELAAKLEGPVRLVGEGAAIFGAAITDAAAGRADVRIDEGEPIWPDARSVGRIGRARIDAGEGRPASVLVPRYLRRTQAEEQADERRASGPAT